jgi:group II intron reverse transcriptase/maturase
MDPFKDTLSYKILLQAFQRVKENRGCAGVDGITIDEFEMDLEKNIASLKNDLLRDIYYPLPLLKILVDKGNGEARPLLIPTVKYRVAQSAVLEVVEPIFEREFEQCSFAYRKGRSVKQAVYQIKEYRDKGYIWVVDADIDSYFDSIDHILLLNKINRFVKDPGILKLMEMWVKAEVWDGKEVTKLTRGIPQGSVISPILANLFLDQLDEELLSQGFKLVRFSDDFIILCKSPEKAKEALGVIEGILDKLLLELDEADIVSFDQGFKYLGVYFVKSMIFTPFDKPKREKKVLYFPPPLNLSSYLSKKKRFGWNG